MVQEYVRVVCNVACKWEGLPPIYRVYVNDELFTERTWTWQDDIYLREEIQLFAQPGEYQIKYQLVPPNLAELIVGIPMIEHGPADILSDGTVRIMHAG